MATFTEDSLRSRIVGLYPHPIAMAWHRVGAFESESARLKHLHEAFEIVLATLQGILAADYLRGPRNPTTDEVLAKSWTRPTLGSRRAAIEALHAAARNRGWTFLPELVTQYPATNDLFLEMVKSRNATVHGVSSLNEAAVRAEADRFERTFSAALQSLAWLEMYLLFRLQQVRPARRGPRKGQVQIFVGVDPSPPRVGAAWGDAELAHGIVYLAHREHGVLEVSPYLQVPPSADNRNNHVYVLSEVASPTRLTMVQPYDGTFAGVPVDPDEPERTWDEHLARPEGQYWPKVKLEGALARGRLEGSFLSEKFTYLKKIGSGAFGDVHLAREAFTGREVALKVLRPDLWGDVRAQRRFRRELESLGRVTHPNVIDASLEYGRGDRPMIRMPYIAGGTLRDRLRRGRLPDPIVLSLARQLYRGLAAIHAEGLIHRDIKPENLLMDGDVLVISDFGLVRIEEPEPGESRLTLTRDVLGTELYFSPEQAEGVPDVGPVSDVYSAALVVQEMLTGVQPRYRGHPVERVDGAWKQFLKVCGRQDPAKRVTAEQALVKLDELFGEDRTVVVEIDPQPLQGTVDAGLVVRLAEVLRQAIDTGAPFPKEAAPWADVPMPDGTTVRQTYDVLLRRHVGRAWPHLLHHVPVRRLLDGVGSRFHEPRIKELLANLETSDGRRKLDLSRIPASTVALRDWVSALSAGASRIVQEPALLTSILHRGLGMSRRDAATHTERLDWSPVMAAIEESAYVARRMPKRSGGFRWIHQPSAVLKSMQAVLARRLGRGLRLPGTVTSFAPRRSLALHARMHAGCRGAVVVDIHDWFGTTSYRKVSTMLRQALQLARVEWSEHAWLALKAMCFHRDRTRVRDFLPQGAPTSPVLANFSARALDAILQRLCDGPFARWRWRYSRYADDLVISSITGGHVFHERAEALMREAIEGEGWHVTTSKVRHWSEARGGPLILCGVQVPETETGRLRLPRDVRRRVRSAVHQARMGRPPAEVRGLLAYAYGIVGYHGLAALIPGQVQDAVRNVGAAVASGDTRLSDTFFDAWTAGAERPPAGKEGPPGR